MNFHFGPWPKRAAVLTWFFKKSAICLDNNNMNLRRRCLCKVNTVVSWKPLDKTITRCLYPSTSLMLFPLILCLSWSLSSLITLQSPIYQLVNRPNRPHKLFFYSFLKVSNLYSKDKVLKKFKIKYVYQNHNVWFCLIQFFF